MLAYALGAMDALARHGEPFGVGPDEITFSPTTNMAHYSPKSPEGQRAAEKAWEARSIEMHARQIEQEALFTRSLPSREDEATAKADKSEPDKRPPSGVIIV
jgi:hypothetical protein